DYRGAYGSFSKTVELSPRNWDAQVQLGRFLLGGGKSEEALEKAELVLKSDAKNEAALILKGAVLVKKKDFDGARRFLESVVGREVRKPDGYMLLTFLYAITGDTKNAEKTLLEGIRFNEKSVPLYIALVDLYLKNKQTDDAVGVMQKLIVMEPDAA